MIRCSICFSTRNKAKLLRRTLQSIFVQEVPFTFEVIVVDDGSSDNTKAVCDEFRVRYIRLESPRYRNPAVARNTAFRAAEGEIILHQSDDVIHMKPDTIARLVNDLPDNEFLLARTHNFQYDDEGNPKLFIREYCGPERKVPYFFLGAIRHEHIYAIGGYDEEFVEPCFDDNWFADCLLKGLKLAYRYTEDVLAHHQSHGYEDGSHDKEDISRKLYKAKVDKANVDGVWVSSGGPWPLKTPGIVYTPAHENEEILTRTMVSTNSSIPKRMNFFWGGERLSFMRFLTLYSFRRFHPDWEIVLYRMHEDMIAERQWTSSEKQDNEIFTGLDYWDRIPDINVEVRDWVPLEGMPEKLTPSHACDLFEWEMLATTGGWYADMDILWIASLPHGTEDANAVFCLSDRWVTIGLFGSSPNNCLFGDILNTAISDYKPEKYQSTGAEAVYHLAGCWPDWGSYEDVGPRSYKALQERYTDIKMVNLPSRVVYPWNWLNIPAIFSDARQPPDGCCGIHWFGGNMIGQNWNAKLDHRNYSGFNNTFTKQAERVIEDGFF